MTAKTRSNPRGRRPSRRAHVGFAGLVALSACSELIGLDGDYFEAVGGRAGSRGDAGTLGEGGDTAASGSGGSAAPGGRANGGDAGAGNESNGGGKGGAAGTSSAGGSTASAGDAGEAGNRGGSGGTAGEAGDGGESPRGGSANGGAGAAGSGGQTGAGGPPSCIGLAETCGPDGEDSCCRSAAVRGGDFDRSNDARFPASISRFELDVYEATVGRFRAFVAAYDGTPPAPGSGKNPRVEADSGWDSAWDAELPSSAEALKASFDCDADLATFTDEPGANEVRPMNCVSWYVAFAFCVWDGGRLPTEAEWNFAAAGGEQQRRYPWSLSPTDPLIDQTYASYFYDGVHRCLGDGVDGCALTDFVLVGSKERGNARWGHADMAGNVYEWVLDVSNGLLDYEPGACDDCAYLESGAERIGRGGCFYSADHLVTTASRVGFDPAEPTTAFGVRCANVQNAPSSPANAASRPKATVGR